MRKYSTTASSDVRIAYGRELLIGLAQVEATRALVPAMQAVQDALRARAKAREDAGDALAVARVEQRFADMALDTAIRGLHRVAELADGARKGPLTDALFPDGLVAETSPTGERQEKQARMLLMRVQESEQQGMADVRAQLGASLAVAVEAFVAAHAAYAAASEASAQAFARELLARDAHRTQLARIIASVQGLYPNDAAMREIFFPEVHAPRAREEDDVPAA